MRFVDDVFMRFFLVFISACLFNFTTAMANKTVRTLIVDENSFTEIQKLSICDNIAIAKFSEQENYISSLNIDRNNYCFFVFINSKKGDVAEFRLKDVHGKCHDFLIKDTVIGNELHLQPKGKDSSLCVKPIKRGYEITLKQH